MPTLTQRILLGISATYPTNKPWEGGGVAGKVMCLHQTPSQQQALKSLKLLICVRVECRLEVEELISFNFLNVRAAI